MAKKPILTDDELDGGLPSGDTPPPPPPPPLPGAGATRPLGMEKSAPSGMATRLVDDPAPEDAPPPPPPPPSPQQQGRDASGHARPKTRIHGYGGPRPEAEPDAMDASPVADPVTGWLVVTAGPGRGASVSLGAGMNGVGRGPENAAQVDFGDDTISREPHAYVTYDTETRLFHLSHGGKTNLVRLNDAPVLTVEGLSHGDTIRIGATSLRFVALCGPDFDWADA